MSEAILWAMATFFSLSLVAAPLNKDRPLLALIGVALTAYAVFAAVYLGKKNER